MYLKFPLSDLIVIEKQRTYHDHPHVRKKLNSLYLKHLGYPHNQISEIIGISTNTLRSYLKEYNLGGLQSILEVKFYRPESDLKAYITLIKDEFSEKPPSSLSEAQHRIAKLTGIYRSITQISAFVKSIGLRQLKVGFIPGKALNEEKQKEQREFISDKLEPNIEEAREGMQQLLFMDAAHFVHGAFLTVLWSFVRAWIPSPSGRKRFNVLGAINAITQELHLVTNTQYINSKSIIEMLNLLSERYKGQLITIVLDNASYQRCNLVKEHAKKTGIRLLFLPSYSPQLNIIERLWKWVKKDCLYGKYYAKFDQFKAGIEKTLEKVNKEETKEQLRTLLNLKFQTFEKAQVVTF